MKILQPHPVAFFPITVRRPAKRWSISPTITKPLQLGFVVLLLFTASCGQIVSSRDSALKNSPAGPIQIGDVMFYYLPRGVINVDGVYKDNALTVTVTPDIHADAHRRYELSLNQRYPFFDHSAILTTDDKGLLKSVYASSTDRTVDAAAALITAAGQALQFAASIAGARTATETPQPFHITLDPFDPKRQDESRGLVRVSVNEPPSMEAPTEDDKVLAGKDRYPGIMTLLMTPFTVTVRNGAETAEVTVLLPDPRQRYLLTAPRGPLVTSDTTVDFVNGCMVTRNVKRPSIAYGILGIPKTILSALVPIPGNVETARNTRIQNEITLLKEKAELHNLQNPSASALPAARESASPTTSPTPEP